MLVLSSLSANKRIPYQRLVRWLCSPSQSAFPPIPPGGNVPPSIAEKIGKNLHRTKNHPINFIKRRIESHFSKSYTDLATGTPLFSMFDNISPVVSVKQNFDDLLFPADHAGRSPNDSYYLSDSSMLRAHTTAHQTELFKKSELAWLVTGDVYRRDEIDRVHYPVFHQMDGGRVFTRPELLSRVGSSNFIPSDRPLDYYYSDPSYMAHPDVKYVENDLKITLEKMVQSVFGKVDIRWVTSTFPFTSPSWEMEIFYNNNWLEVLGCGVVHPAIMTSCGMPQNMGWAFGLGLERLALVLFDIPDIRLFWSSDPRFQNQFLFPENQLVDQIDISQFKFKSFSKYPSCYKDVSFWIPSGYHENQFYELVRGISGDMCESAKIVSKFAHPTTQRSSHCYRITYRSQERSLTNEEVDVIQLKLREAAVKTLGVELR